MSDRVSCSHFTKHTTLWEWHDFCGFHLDIHMRQDTSPSSPLHKTGWEVSILFCFVSRATFLLLVPGIFSQIEFAFSLWAKSLTFQIVIEQKCNFCRRSNFATWKCKMNAKFARSQKYSGYFCASNDYLKSWPILDKWKFYTRRERKFCNWL